MTTTDYETVHQCAIPTLMLKEAPHGGKLHQHRQYTKGQFINPTTADPEELAHVIDVGLVRVVEVPMGETASGPRPGRPADPELTEFTMPTRQIVYTRAEQHCSVKLTPAGEAWSCAARPSHPTPTPPTSNT